MYTYIIGNSHKFKKVQDKVDCDIKYEIKKAISKIYINLYNKITSDSHFFIFLLGWTRIIITPINFHSLATVKF